MSNTHRHKINAMKNENIIIIVIVRILFFVPFLLMAFVGSFVMFFRWMGNYAKHGGETIAYTDKMNRKTIQELYELIDKNSK